MRRGHVTNVERYSRKKNFARHLKVHTDTGFTCQICAKTFNRKDKLQEHVKRLHEEELYKCDICEKTFDNFKIDK